MTFPFSISMKARRTCWFHSNFLLFVHCCCRCWCALLCVVIWLLYLLLFYFSSPSCTFRHSFSFFLSVRFFSRQQIPLSIFTCKLKLYLKQMLFLRFAVATFLSALPDSIALFNFSLLFVLVCLRPCSFVNLFFSLFLFFDLIAGIQYICQSVCLNTIFFYSICKKSEFSFL